MIRWPARSAEQHPTPQEAFGASCFENDTEKEKKAKRKQMHAKEMHDVLSASVLALFESNRIRVLC
jgi:hypothetical protein